MVQFSLVGIFKKLPKYPGYDITRVTNDFIATNLPDLKELTSQGPGVVEASN